MLTDIYAELSTRQGRHKQTLKNSGPLLDVLGLMRDTCTTKDYVRMLRDYAVGALADYNRLKLS